MKANKKRVLKKIEDKREKQKRGPVTLSFNLDVYRRFRATCEADGQTPSTVIETMIEEYLAE